jgi:hypothetical protein
MDSNLLLRVGFGKYNIPKHNLNVLLVGTSCRGDMNY